MNGAPEGAPYVAFLCDSFIVASRQFIVTPRQFIVATGVFIVAIAVFIVETGVFIVETDRFIAASSATLCTAFFSLSASDSPCWHEVTSLLAPTSSLAQIPRRCGRIRDSEPDRPVTSVLGRLVHRLDHQHIDRPTGAFEPQAKLLA